MTMTPGRAEPNVTPLIDVLLVLLVIFMVIVPATPKGMADMVPQRRSGASTTDSGIVLQIHAAGGRLTYLINDNPIEGKSRLSADLHKIFADRAVKLLYVQADPALSFATVVQVIDLSRAAGVEQVAIVTPGMAAGD